MKTCLLVLCLVATAASSVFAETYRAPVVRQRQKPTTNRKPALAPAPVGGAIPRGVRGGNFLQMFNPKAPAKYGTSRDSITYDQNNPSNITGVKLFVFQF
jgi:hypothetical protein